MSTLLQAFDYLMSLPKAEAGELARSAYACMSDSERETSRALADRIAREYATAELRDKFEAVRFVIPDLCAGEVSAENVEFILAALAAGANDPDDRRAFQTMLDDLRKCATGFDQFYATH
jgi:hypothetical protein